MSAQRQKSYYASRELSWLEFNMRVLEEGLDRENPLLERLRFLSIVSSNFDEFFMVRVAALKARIRMGSAIPDLSGQKPEELFLAVTRRAREIVGKQNACLVHDILPALAQRGLKVLRLGEYDQEEEAWLETYYLSQVEPALTPLAVPGPEDEGSLPPPAICASTPPSCSGPRAMRRATAWRWSRCRPTSDASSACLRATTGPSG